MVKILSPALFTVLALLAALSNAAAQNATGLVVSACGALPHKYVASRPAPFTVDTSGKLCTGASGSVDTTVQLGSPTMTGWSVSSCGNQTFVAGNPGPFTVDLNGNLCN